MKRSGQVLRMESERSRFAFIHNASAWFDQIQTIRPSRIRCLHAVIEAVNQGWKFDSQISHACASEKGALRFIARTPKKHFVAHIAPHFPCIRGMGFQNIYSVEIDLAFISLGQPVQGGNLPPKWRSCIAAEDQNDRLVFP